MAVWQSISKHGLVAVGLAVSGSQAALAVPVMTVSAAPQPARVGSTVAVSVSIADIADLYAWQFNLSFNPAILQLASSTEGSFLGSAGGTFFGGGTVDNTAGTLSFAFDSLIGTVPGASGSGTLGRFVFNVTGAGSSPIGFSNQIFLNSALADITVQSVNGTVMAAVVPEPASAVLMGLGLGLGLAGLAASRRRPV